MSGWLGHVLAIARKDLLLELRGRERLLISGSFAVLTAVVFSFSLDPAVAPRLIGGAMVWVAVLFAGLVGLGRSFLMEREQEALSGLLLAPTNRTAIFVGKWLANVVVLLAVQALTLFVFALFFGLGTGRSLPWLAVVLTLGAIGFMAVGTLFSAIAAHTRLGESLLPLLVLPLLLPVVIFGVSATQRLMIGRPVAEVMGNVRMLLAFDLLFVFGCALLFGPAMEE